VILIRYTTNNKYKHEREDPNLDYNLMHDNIVRSTIKNRPIKKSNSINTNINISMDDTRVV